MDQSQMSYVNRILIGCGNSECTNSFCKSSTNFTPIDNPNDVANELFQKKAPLCNMLLSLERLIELSNQQPSKLSDILEEVYSSPESLYYSFITNERYNIYKSWEISDYVMKFLPQYSPSILKGHYNILSKIQSGQQIRIESIISTLSSSIFTEDDKMGEFCGAVQKRFTKEEFDCLLGNIEQYLSLRVVLRRSNEEEYTFYVLQLLNVFYALNDENQFVPEERFYNEVITFLNVKKTLLSYPFIITIEHKMKFLHQEARYEREQSTMQAFRRSFDGEQQQMHFIIEVRRDHVLVDSLNKLVEADVTDLKKPLHVKFVGEEGLDHGGVGKEWFQLVTHEILDQKYGMFVYNEKTRTCWFNSSSDSLNDFKLIGTLFGLAIYNGVILDVKFPLVVYKKLLGLSTQSMDLEEVAPEVKNSFKFIMEYTGDDMEDVLGLTFQHVEDYGGQTRVIDLKPNGGDIPVTLENRIEFIQLMTDYILNVSIDRQFNAFVSGFKLVFNSKLLRIFSPRELELLIAGSDVFDFRELENATRYANGYTKDTPNR
ncbi:HECT-type E3 ubiquitin transferase [Entamoeba marina]